jgi:hypothetical protein
MLFSPASLPPQTIVGKLPVLVRRGLLVAAVALGGGSSPDPAACVAELFRIERSNNANVVVYDLVDRRGEVAEARSPVEAHWVLLADRGQVEGLNVLERLTAYGFDLEAGPGGATVMRLRACRKQRIEIRPVDGCLRPLLPIQGHLSILTSVFVKMRGSSAYSVEAVALRGVAVGSGEALEEWLRPDAPVPSGGADDDSRR